MDELCEPTLAALVEAGVVVTDVATTARILHVGRDAAYRAIAAGEIPSIKVGRFIRVPVAGLAELVGVPAA